MKYTYAKRRSVHRNQSNEVILDRVEYVKYEAGQEGHYIITRDEYEAAVARGEEIEES
mgnify:CR=1 FL=1